VVIGLPDTVWFPDDALSELPDEKFSLLLFRVEQPQLFDSVVTDDNGLARDIKVKSVDARSNWIWGAFKMPGYTLHRLHALWLRRGRQDQYVGTLLNAWLADGNPVQGVYAGEHYVDVGTLGGYREAIRLLGSRTIGTTPFVRSLKGENPGRQHDVTSGR
jgi:NDP-sugar pyrophosphorylase family protein